MTPAPAQAPNLSFFPGASEESGPSSATLSGGPPVDNSDVRDGLGTLLTLDSLSFVMRHRVTGYNPLPDFAAEPSDPTLRRPPNAFQPMGNTPTSPTTGTSPPSHLTLTLIITLIITLTLTLTRTLPNPSSTLTLTL